MDESKLELIKKVEYLYNNTPHGYICDADTILNGLVDDCNMEVSGIALEIFEIWKQADTEHERESIEAMFYIFTEVEFEEYLNKCIKETTREG